MVPVSLVRPRERPQVYAAARPRATLVRALAGRGIAAGATMMVAVLVVCCTASIENWTSDLLREGWRTFRST
jgi:type VI protein secretion system component VasF